ncbi:MAG TPA: plastocyanin/azurin family copper-binding protein [Chloroflexaceae bacterium]|nr:plastocyanin/azurin family copper-binding protein [Chloroflexaceae bacterium]
MSWRPSGGSTPPSRPPSAPRSSGGPPLVDPSLQVLIIATLVLGLVGLGLAAAFGGTLGQGGQAAGQPAQQAQPAVLPTAPLVATAAPAAAAQPTAAPAAGGATIPTEPLGPALASGSGEAVTVGSDGDLLAFDQTEITVPEGLVTLTFANNATAVQHNWVLVDGGDDVASAVNDAAQAQVAATRNAAGAVPPADTPGLLVATQMLNAGESAEVTFETPGPGSYQFICTFPGHYLAGMEGTLIVE